MLNFKKKKIYIQIFIYEFINAIAMKYINWGTELLYFKIKYEYNFLNSNY